jgi:hypothetical protein
METKQEVLKSTDGQPEGQAVLPLATISLDLKSERVQESFAASPASVVSLKLELAVHQPQTVTVAVSGVSTAFTFDNNLAAPAAAAA